MDVPQVMRRVDHSVETTGGPLRILSNAIVTTETNVKPDKASQKIKGQARNTDMVPCAGSLAVTTNVRKRERD